MEELNAFRECLLTQRPTEWEHLPDFSLYMDQVLSYMDRQTIQLDEDDCLTAAMVNNYTKNGLVPKAAGKKYNREHLAYLTAICILKHVLSSKDMDLLIREELQYDRSVETGYRAFCESLDGALKITAEELENYSDQSELADAAIHFALLSYTANMACRRYVSLLRSTHNDLLSKEKEPRKERGKS